MEEKTVLVAGASRGIGLELAVQYASDGWRVVAGCRKPDQARQWLPAGVDIQALDVTAPDSIAALVTHLGATALDLLIVNAGVYGPDTRSFAAPANAVFDEVMHTNVLAPMRLIEAFGPAAVRAGGKIAVVSSHMGSIAGTADSQGLLYRTSKAAVNMAMKVAATEYGPQGVTLVSLHPGWVRTDMGGADATLGVTEAVEQLRVVLDSLTSRNNGCFLDYAGHSLEW